MGRQTQGSFERGFGDEAVEKSLSGSGRKYLRHNFKEMFKNDSIHLRSGDRYYDFEEQCWKRKK